MRQSGYKRNANKRSQGKQIAQLLPDGTICFAGKKLPVRIPSNQDKAAKLREALNMYSTTKGRKTISNLRLTPLAKKNE